MPALRLEPQPSRGERPRAASDVRSAGAADRGHRASRSGLFLRPLRRADPGGFPNGREGPAQYGERVRAGAVYLHAQQLIPEDRTAETLGDLFGAMGFARRAWRNGRGGGRVGLRRSRSGSARSSAPRACAASTILRRCSGRPAHRRADAMAACGGDRNPYPFASAPNAARCRKASKGASSSMTVSNPTASSNCADRPPAHALCNAHHLRELKAIIAFDAEPSAAAMRDCLRDACKATGEARARGPTALSPQALEAFHARYWEALRQGLAWHRSLPRLEKAGSKSGRMKRRETICCSACTGSKTTC